MKAHSFLAMTSLLFAVAAPAQDVPELLADAQRTYIRGDLAGAQEKFELVRRLEPNNRVALSFLRRIGVERAREDAAKGPGTALKTAVESIQLESVKFKDATLPEVLEFLRQKGNQAMAGKVAINFVQKFDTEARDMRVTLSLSNVPMSEVLRYIGELVNVTFTYERFAIVVAPKIAKPAQSEPAREAKGAGIPGLD